MTNESELLTTNQNRVLVCIRFNTVHIFRTILLSSTEVTPHTKQVHPALSKRTFKSRWATPDTETAAAAFTDAAPTAADLVAVGVLLVWPMVASPT